jgi:L-arabinose transport system substrate-binding protein
MSMMHVLKVLAAGLLAAGLACCGESGGGGQPSATNVGGPVKIGFLVKQPDVPWFQNEWKFAEEAAKKHGFEVIKIGVPDGPRTLAAIDTLAGQGAQGLIICTPEPKLGQSIVDRAARGGLKVMSVDDRLKTADGKDLEDVPHMGITAHDIGVQVGKAMGEELKKRGWKAGEAGAAVLTHDEAETHRERTDGIVAGLEASGFPKARVFPMALKEPVGLATGRDAMNSLLTQHSDVRLWLIGSINDDAVVGGVRATENKGLGAADVIGVGIGGDVGLPDLKKEKPTGFFASVLISPKRHGYETAERMYAWIKEGKAPPKVTWTEGILMTRETYRQVLAEQGLE